MTAEVPLTIPKLWSLMLQRLKNSMHGKARKVCRKVKSQTYQSLYRKSMPMGERQGQKEGKIRILHK